MGFFADKRTIKKRMQRGVAGAGIGAILGGPVGAYFGGLGGVMLDRILGEKDNKRRNLRMDEVAAAFRRSGAECEECGTTKNLTVDHITPLSQGGTNDTDNLRILCKNCNSRKGNR